MKCKQSFEKEMCKVYHYSDCDTVVSFNPKISDFNHAKLENLIKNLKAFRKSLKQ